MPLNDAERARVADAIAHFEALQKRYTRQHNGTACEHVKLALEGLNRLTEQPEVVRAYWTHKNNSGKNTRIGDFEEWYECSGCFGSAEWMTEYCPHCGAAMDSKEGEHGGVD